MPDRPPEAVPAQDPVDAVPAAVVGVDLERRVTVWNRGAQALYGWSRAEALGRPVTELFLQGLDRLDAVGGTYRGQPWEGEMPVVRRDGRALTVHVSLVPVRDGAGAVTGVLGAALDADVLHREQDVRSVVVADLAARAHASSARTERLQRLTAALVPARTVQDVADAVVAAGVEAVGASAGSLSLLDPGSPRLRMLAARGYRPEQLQGYQVASLADHLPVARAVLSGRPQLYPDRARWRADYPDLPASPAFGARAAIPVTSGDRALGALALSFTEDREFDEAEVALLVTIGRQAGQAVERAQLLAAEREAAERAAFLASASTLLSRSLALEPTLRSLLSLLVPGLADWAVVHVRDGSRMVGAATAHRDPGADAALAALAIGVALDTSAPGGTAEAVREGHVVEVPSVPDHLRERLRLPQPYEHLGPQLQATSGVSVPVVLAGTVVAALTLARQEGPAYSGTELTVVEELAARAAVALSHARDYERERDRALTLQRSLLPRSLPETPGIAFEWRYLPGAEGALVGGDWYDVLPLEHGRIAVVIGDVMGSGVAAAAVMGQLRATARAYTEAGVRPAELLSRLDGALVRLEQEAITTLLYAVVDPATRELTVASAGHLPPLLCVPGAEPRYLELTPGPPLGAEGGGYTETRVVLPLAATLLLYTDGLVEDRHQPVGLGMERLRASIAASRSTRPADVCDAALAGTRRDRGRTDDTALLAVALSEAELAPFLHRSLHATDALVGLRTDVRQRCRLWQLPESLVEDVLLVLSELTGNALLHAGGEVSVTLRLEPDRVRVEVRDSAPRALPLPSLEALTRSRGRLHDDELDAVIDALTESGTTGRGMALVEHLAARSGVVVEAGGKVVWAELELAPHSALAEPGPPSPTVGTAVRLLSVPVRLVLASSSSVDELLREVLVSSDVPQVRLLSDLGRELSRATVDVREPIRVAAREALSRGQRLVDVRTRATPAAAEALGRLEHVLAELTGLAGQGLLLAEVPDPEVAAFRSWWLAEVVRQLAGQAPQPCPFPALPPGRT